MRHKTFSLGTRHLVHFTRHFGQGWTLSSVEHFKSMGGEMLTITAFGNDTLFGSLEFCTPEDGFAEFCRRFVN
jgi:hypothetical protein